jgi:transcriptional regulator with XRE-family HTH domain
MISERAVSHVRKLLGQRLREVRKQRGLSLRGLGERASLSAAFIGAAA